MTRPKLMIRPTRMADMSFEDYYDNSSDDLQDNKAHRLEVRRWRKLKHQAN